MKTPATKFEVHVNGRRFSDATVNLEDQLEVNLVSVAGQETAILAVTAFAPGVAKGGNYIRSENLVLKPGDRVTISLSTARDVSATVGPPDPEIEKERSTELEATCAFCGKSNIEVQKLIAGAKAFICDECVILCHDIIREET